MLDADMAPADEPIELYGLYEPNMELYGEDIEEPKPDMPDMPE